jgi:hypothetical protein
MFALDLSFFPTHSSWKKPSKDVQVRGKRQANEEKEKYLLFTLAKNIDNGAVIKITPGFSSTKTYIVSPLESKMSMNSSKNRMNLRENRLRSKNEIRRTVLLRYFFYKLFFPNRSCLII